MSVLGMVVVTVFIMSVFHTSQVPNNIHYQYRPLSALKRPKPVAQNDVIYQPNPSRVVTNDTTVWVSMGLCFSENTKLYGKRKYPYVAVTPLALLLWNHFLPKVKLVLYLIYTKRDNDERRKRYQDTLRQIEGLEVRWVESGDMDCVMKSQTSRMWAFNDPMVKDDDIVITIDVNAFIMTSKILDPIYENPRNSIWVFQYEDTADISEDIGASFNENFIAAYADVWRAIIVPEWSKSGSLDQSWIDRQVKEIGLTRKDGEDRWYYDQWITTFGILRNQLCTVPPESGLWNLPGLKNRSLYFPDVDDSDTCWHGLFFRDCNKVARIIPYGCKWWHFYPDQKFDDHVEKFMELTNNSYNLSLSSMFDR